MDNNVTEQPATDTKVVGMDRKKSADKSAAKIPAPTQPEQKLYVITEQAVNQLLNAIGELPGLTWKQTNPLIVFIQQNVKPATGQ